MLHKILFGYRFRLLFFLLFWNTLSHGQALVCEANPDYPMCSGDGSPSLQVNTPEKVYSQFMGDIDLSFNIDRCEIPCMGDNGNPPPPPMGNSLIIDDVIDNDTGVSVGGVPVTNLPSITYTIGSNGEYIVNWPHGLPPGTYTVTFTLCVCFENAGGNAPSCCLSETYTFTLCVIEPVPTMTEWGLFLFALVVLNLGLVFVYHQRHQLEY